jgi:hypothetical protein
MTEEEIAAAMAEAASAQQAKIDAWHAAMEQHRQDVADHHARRLERNRANQERHRLAAVDHARRRYAAADIAADAADK